MTKTSLSPTEKQNKRTAGLDKLPAAKMVELINKEDAQTIKAVRSARKEITAAVKAAAQTLGAGGRIIFMGAGTSGRLGVLEAAECPPTFSSSPQQILGIIAGGPQCMFKAKEGAEDNAELGAKDIAFVTKKDIVFGIAASGKTPYVTGALKAAKKLKAKTFLITCNNQDLEPVADIVIYLPTGAEVLQGSTRMKAATATKMTLNIITTSAMALQGKIYDNLMVDVKPSNAKLKLRAERLVQKIASVTQERARELLLQTGGSVKTAVVMARKNVSKTKAEALLKKNKGFLRGVLNE